MYKCTECGAEFENKPDFCDCGNDEFVITVEKKEETAPLEKTGNAELPKDIDKTTIYSQNLTEKHVLENQYSFLKSLNPFSVCVFVICIILSIVVICIKPKQTEVLDVNDNIKSETLQKDIPAIDKFWDNSVKEVKIVSEETKNINKNAVKNPIQTQQKSQAQKKNIEQKEKSSPKIVKTKSAAVSKALQNKPTTQKTQTTPKTIQSSTKPQQTAVQPQTVKPIQNSQVQKSQTVYQAVQQSQVQKTVQTASQNITSEAARKELADYKARLRNTIGQKIDFTQVIGDGVCTVSFKISSAGKLINRSFTRQSDNITLNDAVYKAVMSTPSYKAPPAAYNNETLNLNIKFYNGNFEISLK